MTTDPYAGKVKVYETIIDRLNRPIHAIAYKMAPGEAGDRVLDIGCGTGAQLTRYMEAGCLVSGVDLSPAMLNSARSRLGPDADLHNANATALPFHDDEFDIVICSMFLHELDPTVRSEVLSEAARVAGDEGKLVIVEFDATPRRGAKQKTRRLFSMIVERVAGSTHYQNFRSFVAAGGVPAELAAHDLDTEQSREFPGGDLAIYVVGRNATG